MADNFGLKIGIEGEKEFKNSLRDINQSFKVLGSEMKLVSSEFSKNDKSMQAVAARTEVLSRAIDTQKQKITTLETALKNASESFGENDRRTQNWAAQLNNAKAELNGMERELRESADATNDLGGQLRDAGDSAEKSSSKFEKLGGIDKRLEELQTELLKLATSNSDYDKVGDEIHRLRDQKQKLQVENANRDELKKRMADMSVFLKKQSTALIEYDEQLVRRLIDKITIFEDKIAVEFKSGLTVDVND